MRRFDSLDAFIEELPALAERARDRLQGREDAFRLETLEGNVYDVEILPDGQVTVGPLSREPDCTLTASESDLLAVVHGELSPAKALLFRKVRVRGQIARLTALIALMG